MKKYKNIIKHFSDARICVIGDMTADVYVYGKPYRLSREAPVIVVRFDYQELIPGGAANTVNNLLDLGAQVYPVGILGNDYFGTRLFSYLEKKCSHMDGMILDPEFPTITKTRILAGDDNTTKQQVIRIDRDMEQTLSAENQKRILSCLKDIASEIDAVIVSDYGYGLFNGEVLGFLRKLAKEKVVVVDSRYHMKEFTGVTIVTPNQSEAEYLTGLAIEDEKTLHQAGEKILDSIKSKAVLITQGNKGMTLFEHGKKPVHIPVFGSDKISDVTGAGDTVVSLIALSLVAGARYPDAARLANYGASVVVMKPGTATLTSQELIGAVESDGKG